MYLSILAYRLWNVTLFILMVNRLFYFILLSFYFHYYCYCYQYYHNIYHYNYYYYFFLSEAILVLLVIFIFVPPSYPRPAANEKNLPPSSECSPPEQARQESSCWGSQIVRQNSLLFLQKWQKIIVVHPHTRIVIMPTVTPKLLAFADPKFSWLLYL